MLVDICLPCNVLRALLQRLRQHAYWRERRAEDPPRTGHARRQLQARAMPSLDAHVLLDHQRTGSHEARLSFEDVQQLRNLIERGLAQQPRDACVSPAMANASAWASAMRSGPLAVGVRQDETRRAHR
jgi:hypothetical protein